MAEAERHQGWEYVNPYGRFNTAWHLLNTNDRSWVAHGCRLLTTPDFLQATLGDEAKRLDDQL